MLNNRAQAAVDFMTSYGIVLLAIALTVYIVFQLGVFNYALAPQYCYSVSSVSCLAYVLNTNAVLTVQFTQSSGGVFNITGVACSTSQNNTQNGPMFGNVKILSPLAGPQFYPDSTLNHGILVYAGNTVQLKVYCYTSPGVTANGILGNVYTGYVWFKYTYTNLPQNQPIVQQVLSVSVRYT